VGIKIGFELLISEVEKAMIEKYKINVSKVCVEALQTELKLKYDLMLACQFHDERAKITVLEKENDCLRQRLERKSQPVIHLGVRRDSVWRNAQENGIENTEQAHKHAAPVLRR